MARQERCGFVQLVFLLAMLEIVNARMYTVGDDIGTWTVPASTNGLNYSDWAMRINFRFGDEIFFKYSNTSHSVLLVNETSYTSCLTLEPIQEYLFGDDTVVLNISGARDYYFICGFPTHCFLQQKFHVTLVGLVPPGPTSDLSPPALLSPERSGAPIGFQALGVIGKLVVCYAVAVMLRRSWFDDVTTSF